MQSVKIDNRGTIILSQQQQEQVKLNRLMMMMTIRGWQASVCTDQKRFHMFKPMKTTVALLLQVEAALLLELLIVLSLTIFVMIILFS